MNYQGFQVVTTNVDIDNILKAIRPRMVVIYPIDEGQWAAVSFNELGFIVESVASNQVHAVDLVIQKATSKLTHYHGIQVKKLNVAIKKSESIIYWETPKFGEDYECELTLRIDGVKTTFSGHGRTLENALEHVYLKIHGLNISLD
ncbi:hypothetical protein VCHA53O466_50539 [Vibrio chagasii]|nr:hypothetical protein VCHA53O466_50539 [Vibrio chagasii]